MLTSETRTGTGQRMSYIALAFFGNSLERSSAMVRLISEKSLSDSAELAEMQRMRLATLADSGNFLPVCHSPSKIPAERCVWSGTHIALASSSRPDARL